MERHRHSRVSVIGLGPDGPGHGPQRCWPRGTRSRCGTAPPRGPTPWSPRARCGPATPSAALAAAEPGRAQPDRLRRHVRRPGRPRGRAGRTGGRQPQLGHPRPDPGGRAGGSPSAARRCWWAGSWCRPRWSARRARSSFYSGPREVLDAHRAAAGVIGRPEYLGPDPALAQLYYQAQLDYFLTALAAYLHSTRAGRDGGGERRRSTCRTPWRWPTRSRPTCPRLRPSSTPASYPGDGRRRR